MRHVYFVLLNKGTGKGVALVSVFTISALFHEYVVSASIGVWSYFAFMAMMSQAPVMLLEKTILNKLLKNSQLGNLSFWFSFCIVG